MVQNEVEGGGRRQGTTIAIWEVNSQAGCQTINSNLSDREGEESQD